MARAAVKAKQAQAKKAQPGGGKSRAVSKGRRGHAAGGNPNQQLFFSRLRRKAKFAYLLLAILFAVTFAFLGVGSGSGGLDQLFSGLNIFSSSGTSVSKALGEIKKHPTAAKGYRDLATAYESKGNQANAIGALQQYTTYAPKDANAWSELAGLQLSQAQNDVAQYQAAAQNQQLAAPSQGFAPSGKLGTALGTDPIEQAAASTANTATTDLYQRATLEYSGAISSYKQLVKLKPANADAQFQLAQAAQTAGDAPTAVAAYKAYLKLNPDSSTAAQIKQLIKQLSPAPAKPAKKKSGK
ncbi:MAG TPA: tetratricopeptide repeat protein [Gaiellaceae bacterium]|nr:tetratricopeptide repeat protein [Gaiellaceae bacterium]